MHGGHLLDLCLPTGPEGSRQSDVFLPRECVLSVPHPPFDPHRFVAVAASTSGASLTLSLSLSSLPSFPSVTAADATGRFYRAPLPQWSATQATDIGVMELWRPRREVPITRTTASPRSSRASGSRSCTWRACMYGVRRTTGTCVQQRSRGMTCDG